MSDWTTQSLEQAGVVLIDCVHATPEARPEGYPYVAIPQMKDGRIDFSSARKISREDFEQWTRKARPQKHDIVLSRRTNPGVTAPVDDNCDFALGQNLVLLRADGASVLPEFLRWLVSCPAWWEQIAKFNNVGAVFDSLRCADVPRFVLPIPPKSEQAKISALLGALDDKIELNRRMNETLEAMARAIFKDWFVDFGPTRAKMDGRAPYLAPDIWSRFPDRLDDEGKPEGWGRKSVYDHADYVNGAAYKDMHFTTDGSGWPVVKIAELKAGITAQTRFTATDLGDRYQIDNGELLFSWSGNPDTSIDTFIWQNGKAWLNQHIFAVRSNGAATKAYMYLLLRHLKPQFAEIARNKQTTGLGHVTMQDLRRLTMAFPLEPIRQAFEHHAAPLIEKLELNIAQSRTLTSLRDLLLPKLMSGEIRIMDAEKMVGDAT